MWLKGLTYFDRAEGHVLYGLASFKVLTTVPLWMLLQNSVNFDNNF